MNGDKGVQQRVRLILMYESSAYAAQFVESNRETTGDVRRQLTISVLGGIETLEEGKVPWICQFFSVEGGDLLDDAVSVADADTVVVDGLGSIVVRRCGIREMARINIDDRLVCVKWTEVKYERIDSRRGERTILMVKPVFAAMAPPLTGKVNLATGILSVAMMRPMGVWLQLPVVICFPLVSTVF